MNIILSSHLFQDEAAITNFQGKRAKGENKRNEKIAWYCNHYHKAMKMLLVVYFDFWILQGFRCSDFKKIGLYKLSNL